jgi:8-oxo-dGTP diphosphatase
MESESEMTRFFQPDGHLHGVIVACQRADGRWLLIRRSATVPAPLGVCFPGGGMDEGETQAEAVVREMREELGAEVVPVCCAWQYHAPARRLTLWGWLAELRSDHLIPSPDEVHEILWMTAEEILTHPEVLPRTNIFIASVLQAAPYREHYGRIDFRDGKVPHAPLPLAHPPMERSI